MKLYSPNIGEQQKKMSGEHKTQNIQYKSKNLTI